MLLQLVLSITDPMHLVDFSEKVRVTGDRLLLGVEIEGRLTLNIRVHVLLHIIELLVVYPTH